MHGNSNMKKVLGFTTGIRDFQVYDVCETDFMNSSVTESCWYVEEPYMEKRSKSCLSSFAFHLVLYMSWDMQRYLCCSFNEVFLVLLLSEVVPQLVHDRLLPHPQLFINQPYPHCYVCLKYR